MASVVGAVTGGVAGIAVGEASSVALDPTFEPVKQDAWRKKPLKIHELEQLAQLVAQALVSVQDASDDAHRNGYDDDEFNSAIQLALRAPGVSEALALYRRRALDGIDQATALARLHHAFAKAQIEYQYWPQLTALEQLPLDPAVIANAIVRGIMDAPFELPYVINETPGRVQPFPKSPLDAKTEAAASGTDVQRLFVETAIAGRPMAPEEAATAVFRNIIDRSDYDRAIAEGDIRSEYRDAIFERERQILTAHDGAELRLRGVTDQTGARAIAGLHGMSDSDADLLYEMLGRGLAVHQITTGLARGGTYQGDTSQIPPEYLDELHRSSLRPEYFNLAYANRYSYPSLFQLNALVKAGGVLPAVAVDWAQKEGMAPEVVDALFTYWESVYPGPGGATTAKKTPPEVKSQQTALLTEIRKQYTAGKATYNNVTLALLPLGYSQAIVDEMVHVWDQWVAFDASIAPTPTGTTSGSPSATPPPPVPSNAEIDALVAAGWTVDYPVPAPTPVVQALIANGYFVSPPPPKPFLPNTGNEPTT